MLNSIFENTSTSSVSLSSLLLSFVISIILGFVIAIVHKRTSKYSKNFLITVSLLPILVQSVMLMVNGNLGTSIAIMGAFGLIRFRSIPGTSKEILTVFFSMAVGLATGMGQIWFAMLLTVIGCLLILIFNKVDIFDKNKNEKRLKVLIPEDLDYQNVFDDIFEEYTTFNSLDTVKTTNMGSMFELDYTVILKSNVSEKDFIDKIRIRNSNLKISLSRDIYGYDL